MSETFAPRLPTLSRSEAWRESTASAVPKMPLESVVNLLALGGVVYVATTTNVYRVEGDELVRLHWPRDPQRRRKNGG